MKKYTVFVIFFACVLFIGISFADGEHVYDSHGKRDPFVPLIGGTKASVESLEDALSLDDLTFQGIGMASGKKVVILNNEMLAEGQTVGRVTAKKILKDKVILMIDDDEFELIFSEEALKGGQGG